MDRGELRRWADLDHGDLTVPKAFVEMARTTLAALDLVDAIRADQRLDHIEAPDSTCQACGEEWPCGSSLGCAWSRPGVGSCTRDSGHDGKHHVARGEYVFGVDRSQESIASKTSTD